MESTVDEHAEVNKKGVIYEVLLFVKRTGSRRRGETLRVPGLGDKRTTRLLLFIN
jgi:hypothetical protein